VQRAKWFLYSTAASACFLVSAGAALAQDTQQTTPDQPQTTLPEAEETAAQPGEQIVVTGSRIGRTNLTSTSPVTTLGRDDIVLDTALNIENVLNELPQFTGSLGAVSNGNDARGASTLDLRGLGQNRTLVLVNGTRAVPFGFRNSVDVAAIPAPLIERVEVLTGGASAVYGADAVAGVVNFILRRDFEGIDVAGIANVSEEGDAESYGANLTVGTNFGGGRGNISGYLGWSQRGALFKRDRSDFATPERNDAGIILGRPAGGTFTRSDNASVFNFGGTRQPRFAFSEAGALSSTAQFSEFSAGESLIQPQERLTGALFFHFEASDAFEIYGRAMASKIETQDFLVPPNASVSFLVQRDNPFITPELAQVLAPAFNRTRAGVVGGTDAFQATALRAFPELGVRGFDTERVSYQGQLGVRGAITPNIRWDAYVQYGKTEEDTLLLGEGIVNRLRQGVNVTRDAAGRPVCVDPSGGCVPINLFGPGSLSPEAVAFVREDLEQGRDRDQLVTALALTGDTGDFFSLPAGGIDFALGVEYREENGTVFFDPQINQGLAFGAGTRPNFGGGYNVKEAFAEIRVPILADRPFFERLDFEAAYRISDYSTAGTVDAYKLGGNWALNRSIRIRGAYQTVVRAPNIGELFGAPGSIALNAVDPCANPAASGASAQVCQATGAPAAPYTQDLTGALFLFGGNPDLQPEEGRTYTIGAVFTPEFLPGFSLTGDYYDIKIDNAIGAVLPQATLDTCYVITKDAANPFCARVTRGADGQIDAVDSSDVNVALLRVQGIDLGARYGLDLGGGRATLEYAGDIVTSQKQKNGAAATTIECAGRFGATCGLEFRRALPKYRHRMTVGYREEDGVGVRFTWRMLGSVKDDSPTVFKVERIDARHYFDLAASFEASERFTFVLGVENLLDRKPPIVGTQQADANTFPASYDVVGRRFGVSVIVRQ
jgi:outer membrane receptor protein involved in Fe transport